MSEAETVEAPRHAGGRPSAYDPDFCERVIELGLEGKSKTYMAGQLGVVPNTLDNWAAVHPEFLSALERAAVLSQCWWEDQGQKGLAAGVINAPVWSRSMAARFPREWRESTKQELSGPDGGAIPSDVTIRFVRPAPVSGD